MAIKYNTFNQENEKDNYNDKFINLIISTTMNILNSLINEIISNNESKLYQDTTTWNIPYIDTQYVDYNIKNDIDKNLYSHIFFSQHNDISTGLNVVTYDPQKNGRQCYNCKNNFYHQCCNACKKTSGNCKCVFICGLSEPCQYNRYGQITQYRKCKWSTSNLDNFNHECKGFNSDQITKFKTQDSRSFYHSYNIDNV